MVRLPHPTSWTIATSDRNYTLLISINVVQVVLRGLPPNASDRSLFCLLRWIVMLRSQHRTEQLNLAATN